jgi:hypothetical protein
MYDHFMESTIVHTESQQQAGERLLGEIAVACGQLNAAHARLVDLVGQVLDTGAHVDMTPRAFLALYTGLGPGQIDTLLRLARARVTHPQVLSVFTAGRVSVDQAGLAVKAPAVLDPQIAELAAHATCAQLRVLVRAAKASCPPPSRGERSPEPFSGCFDDDGRLWFRGSLEPDDSRVVNDAMCEARDYLFRHGHSDVTWADALAEIAHRSLDAVTTAARRDRFRSYVFIDPTREPVAARWVDGIVLPDWLTEQILCDTTVTPVHLVHGRRPVNLGTSRATPPPHARRLVLHRDQKCRVPWCTQSRWLQIHHIIHREDHGPTDTCNLVALCGHHHRLHHKGKLGITGNADHPDGLTFSDQHGRAIDPAPHPSPPTGPPPPAPHYRGTSGDRLQRWAIHFTVPPHPN